MTTGWRTGVWGDSPLPNKGGGGSKETPQSLEFPKDNGTDQPVLS